MYVNTHFIPHIYINKCVQVAELKVQHVEKDLEFQQDVNTHFMDSLHNITTGIHQRIMTAKTAFQTSLDTANGRLDALVSMHTYIHTHMHKTLKGSSNGRLVDALVSIINNMCISIHVFEEFEVASAYIHACLCLSFY
jgi:hypothetical protein